MISVEKMLSVVGDVASTEDKTGDCIETVVVISVEKMLSVVGDVASTEDRTAGGEDVE